MAISVFRDVVRDFVSLFFPQFCFACEGNLVHGENGICSECLLDLPKTDFHNNIHNEFYQKLAGRLPVKYVLAQFMFNKRGKVQKLLHHLKYRNRPEIGVALGRAYGSVLLKANYKTEFDLIIPVPLHPIRQQKRGYNQSLEFAKGLSEAMNIPYADDLVQRVLQTETQTKHTKLKRWQNVSEVFKVVNEDLLRNKKILLVDDVMTTGSTLEACGKVILDCNITDISFTCIASAR
ncbi:MAG TPA: ComF family protein [Cyclobacteriaceae bacterium]|nr:ComF family protein [Cyclobacteriaceae bacterium]